MNTSKSVLEEYIALAFDCDGVVLDSNRVKTEAFRKATLPYGRAAAQAMVDYHVANGGVSRYKKFAHFLEHLVHIDVEDKCSAMDVLLANYALYVRHGLLSCEIAPGLDALRRQTASARWLIVSGGDQAELRDVFAQRGIAEFFDGGIFGSPDSKEEILTRELASANIQQPALFLGDSKYDYLAARSAGLDFVFISGWSELENWNEWVVAHQLSHAQGVQNLVSHCF
jgi:phosphoglycolate phosphatase-like HAD superfamily hydrolase